MKALEMSKEDFKKIPMCEYHYGAKDFNPKMFRSLVIVPVGKLHDSGYDCMDFVALNEDDEPLYRMSGISDVLLLDGFGGYGYDLFNKKNHKITGWAIDCLPCGYLRIFLTGGKDRRIAYVDDSPYSSFEIFDSVELEGSR